VDGVCFDDPAQGLNTTWYEVGSSLTPSDYLLLDVELRGPHRLKKPAIEMQSLVIPLSSDMWDSKYEVSCSPEGGVCAPIFPSIGNSYGEPYEHSGDLFSDADCTSPVFESALDDTGGLFTSNFDDFCGHYQGSYRAAPHDGPVFLLDGENCNQVEATSDQKFYSWWAELTDLVPLL
jgi:hypothetical protein